MKPILHIAKGSRGREANTFYLAPEELFCGASGVSAITNRGEPGWTILDRLEFATQEDEYYRGYKVCEECLAHPDVALHLLGAV